MNSEYQIREMLNIDNNSIEIFLIIGENMYYTNGYPEIEKAYLNINNAKQYQKLNDQIYSMNDINLYIRKIEISIKINGDLYILSNKLNYNLKYILSILE